MSLNGKKHQCSNDQHIFWCECVILYIVLNDLQKNELKKIYMYTRFTYYTKYTTHTT